MLTWYFKKDVYMPQIDFRLHAIRRMFERNISIEDIHAVLESGEIIQDYPDDKPYPIRLLLGWRDNRPLHIVLAEDKQNDKIIIITAYEPDPNLWHPDFKNKKDTSS